MGVIQIDLPEIHQEIIMDDHRYKVINAGRGFAKSGLLLADGAKDLTVEYKHPTGQPAGSRIIYGAPTYKEGRDIIWERAKSFLDPFIDGRPNESRLEIPLINSSLFVIKGCDNPDSLRGPYCTKFLGDEFAFHKQGYLMKIVRPMLGKVRPFGSVTLGSTPDGRNEFYDFFQRGQGKDPDWRSWQYSSLEGGFMDPQEVEDGRKEMTLAQWRQEYFAEFITPSNMVYYAFNRAVHCRKIKPNTQKYTVHWAWDFNSAHGSCSVLSHVLDKTTYFFDEICVGPTPDCVAEFIKRYPPGTVKEIKLYGDYNGTYGTTGTTDFHEIQKILYDAGYPYPELCVYGGNPLVRSRTNNVNRLLQDAYGDSYVYVDSERCPRLIKDFEQVKYSEKTGKIDKTSDPTLTHAVDGPGYQLWVMFPPKWAEQESINKETKREVINSSGYWV